MYSHASLEALDQAVRLQIDAGDGLHLWFDDRRVGARRDDRDIALRLTGADVVHDLVAVRVRGTFGGVELDERLTPEPHQFFRATWDGTGAEAGGSYVTDLQVGWELAGRFPRPDRIRWWERRVVCGSVDVRSFGCGGFLPATVHRLDPSADVLWRGDGTTLEAASSRRAAVLANVQVGEHEHAVPDGELVHVFSPEGLLEGTLQARKGRVIATAEHDDAGRLVRYSNHGHEFAIEHRPDPRGRGGEVLIESPSEVWVGIELDDRGRAITVLDHERRRLSLTYSVTGCLERVDHPNGRVTEIERDPLGRAVEVRESTGRVQRLTTGEAGDVTVTTGEHRSIRLARHVTPEGVHVDSTVDGSGLETRREVDEDTTTLFAANGTVRTTTRSVRSTDRAPIAVEQTVLEAPSGRILQQTRESAHDAERLTIANRVWVMRFDPKTNTLTAVRPDELESTVRHAPGTALVVTPPGRSDLEIRFDAHRRPKRRRLDGVETVFGYDQYGRMAWAEHDRNRHQVRHDERGRLVGVKSPDGWLHFRRTDEGWIDEVESATGAITSFERGLDGRLCRIVRPEVDGRRAWTEFGHDLDGLLVAHQHIDGSDSLPQVDYERDSAGRITAITTEGRKILARHSADHGELIELAADDGERLTWTWDGDMCWATDVEGATPARIERVFDDDHRIAVRSVNRTAAVSHAYDDGGWLRSVGPLAIERNLSARDVVGWRLGALSTRMTLDSAGRVMSQETRLGKMATVFFAERIERDAQGRISAVAEHVQGVDRLLTYTYDDAGRLATAAVNGTEVVSLRWDANGNPTHMTRDGRRMVFEVDAADRLLGVAGQPVAHDPAGNVVSIGEGRLRALTWNGLGQLVETLDGRGQHTRFTLDPLGRPVDVRANDAADADWHQHRLVWDGDRVAATLNDADEIDIRFLDTRDLDGAPQALVRDGDEYLMVRDHVGSVRAVIEATSGTVVQSLVFDPLGRVLQDTNPGWQPFGFAGGLTDPTSGLVRFGRRVYDPLLGRYLSPDPDGFVGSLNRYLFRGGDPINGFAPADDVRRTLATTHRRPSSPLGELSVATDPYLFDRPVSIDRSWLASEALQAGLAGPEPVDAVQNLLSQWTTERVTDAATFDRVWDPLDACHGRGGFEYQPSPTPPAAGRVARLRQLRADPPTLGDVLGRVRNDLARLVDGLPD